MTLKEYLKYKKIRLEDFAREAGYSVSYFNKIHSGAKPAGRGLAYKLELLTGGMVTAKEMLGETK